MYFCPSILRKKRYTREVDFSAISSRALRTSLAMPSTGLRLMLPCAARYPLRDGPLSGLNARGRLEIFHGKSISTHVR